MSLDEDDKRVLFALAELQYEESERTGLPLDECMIPDWMVLERVNQDLNKPLAEIIERVKNKYPD